MSTNDPPWTWGLRVPDEILLRRFGLVRAVGGSTYLVAVIVLFGFFGRDIWPLALGVPVLLVVTTGFFSYSARYPRTSVVVTLVADALVLGGAVSFLGGTGSGLVMLYSIVVVSAGIMLGPSSALGFTALSVFLGFAQLVQEELGMPPVLLHRPDLEDRLPVLLVSLAGVASVGYLSATYASRLHDLIAEAGAEAEVVRRRGRRRRGFARQAGEDVQVHLREVERVAETLDEQWAEMGEADRRRLAGKLRMTALELDADVGKLLDVDVIDEVVDARPQPVRLRRVVDDCIVALGDRLDGYSVDLDVEPITVVADRRAARRVVLNLLENIVEHTPPGTRMHITTLAAAGHAALAITDDGPGIPPDRAKTLFDPPVDGARRRVGLPLVRELCAAMGAEVGYEPGPSGGARFLVSFRQAPTAAPAED